MTTNDKNDEQELLQKQATWFEWQLSQKNKAISVLQEIIVNQQYIIQQQNAYFDRLTNGASYRLGKAITGLPKLLLGKTSTEDTSFFNKYSYNSFFNLDDQPYAFFGNHRHGWGYVVSCLAAFNNPNGMYLDTFVERTFDWKPGGVKPTLQPWIGFIHVPPKVPDWFHSEQSNDVIFASEAWQQSYPFCKGLFTLSNYHKKNLEQKLDIPINNLYHPTGPSSRIWSWDNFRKNPRKKIIQVGWWLRKIHAIFELPASDYQKVFLRPSIHDYFREIFDNERERREAQGLFRPSMYDTAELMDYIPDVEYDRLLSENILFADLYDSSANNLVVECIAGQVPLLINPLEAVVEYLGEDYPFYYADYEQAIEKASDLDLVRQTHEYLKDERLRQKISIDSFIDGLMNSEIVKSIGQP